MSGTSLDGVDAAAILTDGQNIFDFGATEYHRYSKQEQEILRSALGCWQGDSSVAEAEQIVTQAHIKILNRFSCDAVAGVHGQTLAHDPSKRRTHQTVDAGRIARETNRTVVWDFRTADMEASGQGAPLAPFYHHALARHLKLNAPIVFLNLGGVGNLTWADPSAPVPERSSALLAFDTGPANGPINDLTYSRTKKPYDQDGLLAAAGQVKHKVVTDFLKHSYFLDPPPKSLDRNEFTALLDAVGALSTKDAAATLTACAAESVALAIQRMRKRSELVAVCGGGRRNPVLMKMLANRLPQKIVAVEELGLNGDMLEAQAFGFLSARVLRGLPTSSPTTTGCVRPTCGGQISVPARL